MPLTNTQYDEIMRAYERRQLRRQRLIAARREELSRTAPAIAGLDAQIASLSVGRAKRLLSGGKTDPSGFKAQLGALAEQKKRILQELGYPADYLCPPYECPDCEDTGYIGGQRCHCLKQAAIDLVYAQSNLRDILQKENFSRFSFSCYADDIYDKDTGISSLDAAKNAYAKCRRFVRDFDSAFENIFIFGDTGVGKTFLSHCVAKELLDSGHSVIYFSACRFFEILAKNTFARDADASTDYRNIFDCDLLIIDDLGTEMVNAFTASQFFACLNERLRSQKSTVISSNLGLSDIASVYSERIFSRISNSFILLHLFGRDIRILRKLDG